MNHAQRPALKEPFAMTQKLPSYGLVMPDPRGHTVDMNDIAGVAIERAPAIADHMAHMDDSSLSDLHQDSPIWWPC